MFTVKILTAREMNEIDRLTSEEYGLPSLLLMENAGLHLYTVLREYFEEDLDLCRIAILCGKGNNGGDGLVLARQLAQRRIYPDVYLLSKVEDVSGDARINLTAYLKSGAEVAEITDSQQWKEASPQFSHYHIIVDALLGTGISKPLKGIYSDAVSTINSSGAFVLSVDIPSGMFSDALTAGVLTVQADATVTFAAPKIAHLLNEDQEAIGDLHIVPIGTPAELLLKPEHSVSMITREELSLLLPAREIKAHKGTFGHVAVVSGSTGKTGAAVLGGTAALRTGSGLVTVCSPDVVQPIIASFEPALMTEGFKSTSKGTFGKEASKELLEVLKAKDAAGIGPGLTRDKETEEFIHQVVQEATVPLVLDADAINAFEGQVDQLKNNHDQPLVLTPHPGEFSRLTGQRIQAILSDRIERSRRFAQERELWVVLKGFRTIAAEPGGQVFVCPLGNPGMATAGMGDVLTGVLTALLGMFSSQGITGKDQISQAICLGVYLHSLAGDLAAEEIGEESLISTDVLDYLGAAYEQLSGSN